MLGSGSQSGSTDLVRSLKIASANHLKRIALLEHENRELKEEVDAKNGFIMKSQINEGKYQRVLRQVEVQNEEIRRYVSEIMQMREQLVYLRKAREEDTAELQRVRAENERQRIELEKRSAVSDTVFNYIYMLKIELCEKQLEIERLHAQKEAQTKPRPVENARSIEYRIHELRQKQQK